MDEKKDKGLQGNEKIEEAILALQQEPTEELLAHALTVVRRRMREQGQFIVAVEPPSADVQEAVMQAACRNRYAFTGGADLRWKKMVVGVHRLRRTIKRRRQCDVYVPHGYRAAVSHDADRRGH